MQKTFENIMIGVTFMYSGVWTFVKCLKQERPFYQSLKMLGLTMGILIGMVIVLTAASGSVGAEYELPPRTTPDPGVTTSTDFGNSDGTRIHLEGIFASTWPWDRVHWQQGLWHTIEWMDAAGVWHMVDGWQGQYDTVFQESDHWIGRKELWAASDHLGSGPYRAQIYDAGSGRLLNRSEQFYLPTETGSIVTVRIEIATP